MLSFDRVRLDGLRVALGASLEELRAIRSTDAAAADVMRALRGACRTIEDWLPRVHAILNSTAMTSCTRSALGVADMSQARTYAVMYQHGREVVADPLAVLGPPAPSHDWKFDEVLAAVESGSLRAMNAPMDAHGRAGVPYESLSFAPRSPPEEVGRIDTTSDAAKFADFWSDGLAVGFRHSETMIVVRVDNVRLTKRVHRLTAFDRDDGPETMEGLTTEATTSGFLIITQVVERGELTHAISEDGDDTADFEIATQDSSAFSGAYYPDSDPIFEAVPDGPRYESPDRWTFTTSASPMKDDWGTWHA